MFQPGAFHMTESSQFIMWLRHYAREVESAKEDK
jgi:hypothetical protein